MGQVAERQERGAASNGKESLRPRASGDQQVVPGKPAQADPHAAHPPDCDDAGPLCLLRHIRQLPTVKLVRRCGPEDLAEVAVATGKPIPLGLLQCSPKATPSTGGPDDPSLR